MTVDDRRQPGTTMAAIGATAAAAALLYFGTGPDPIPALTWLAALPLFLLAPRVSARVALLAAFVAGFLGTANSWSYFLGSDSIPLPMVAVIVLGSSSLLLLSVALFRAQVLRGRPLTAALAAPAIWVSGLYVVSLTSPVGVMGTFATSQADQPTVVQIAAVTGAWGVEYLVLLVPAAVAAPLAPGIAKAARLRAGAVVALFLVAVLGYGLVRQQGSTTSQLRVAAIAQTDNKWATDVNSPSGKEILQSYVDQIAVLPAGVRIVVLPEAVFTVEEADTDALVLPIRQAAAAKGADVAVGAIVKRSQGSKYNAVFGVPADGGPAAVFHKWHVGDSPGTVPGDKLAYLSTGVGLQNCMDVNFPSPARDYALEKTSLLAVPADDEDVDGWQHSRTALLRGVENGLAMAWAATDGRTLVTDPFGKVLAEDRTGGKPFAVAVADVPGGVAPTPYSRLGEWFAWLSAAMTLIATVTSLRTRATGRGRE
ncbi:nitrilase-related carbon-nitrogen hydrolase [Amycolatopsis pittospori]|uniref:nitrilase-related carbon-nitrogen hydrolase n=1 Tax=Amycolatopsis pittospori TaxID=2749434 RepID=UPI0015F06612|nr:nitrilase-related carbon-nitrogen hydrolase [Amycolatopsis pittospori]